MLPKAMIDPLVLCVAPSCISFPVTRSREIDQINLQKCMFVLLFFKALQRLPKCMQTNVHKH